MTSWWRTSSSIPIAAAPPQLAVDIVGGQMGGGTALKELTSGL